MRPNRYFADQYEGDGDPDLRSYADAGHVLYAHKATEGAAHIDTRHAERVRFAHAQGLTVMHYHYCRPDQNNPFLEMLNSWRVVKPTWQDGDILALDFETAARAKGHLPSTRYIEECWLKLRGNSGHTAVVYGSTSFLENNTRAKWLRSKRRWQAQYGRGPGRMPWGTGWWAWQASDGIVGPDPHRLAGIPEGDISVLNLRTAVRLSVVASGRRRRRK